eukprot:525438-Pelagomonas_calceolata.AAC.8
MASPHVRTCTRPSHFEGEEEKGRACAEEEGHACAEEEGRACAEEEGHACAFTVLATCRGRM